MAYQIGSEISTYLPDQGNILRACKITDRRIPKRGEYCIHPKKLDGVKLNTPPFDMAIEADRQYWIVELIP